MSFEETVDLREYWQIIRKRKILIVLPFLIVLLIAVGGSFILIPSYESSTAVMIAQIELFSRSVKDIVPQVDMSRLSREEREQRLATIRNQIISSGYLRRLIYELGLDQAPNVVKLAAKAKAQFPDLSEQELRERILIDLLRKKIKVEFKGENLVEITVSSNTPKLAADMSRTLAQIFIEESLKYELFAVRGALDFSDEQLAIYKKKLEESEDKLRRFKQETLKSSIDDKIANQDNINEVVSVRDATKLELNETEDELKFLKKSVESGAHKPILTYSNELSSLNSDLLSQVRLYSDLLARYSWKDAKVMSLNQKIGNTLEEIEKEINGIAPEQYTQSEPQALSQIERFVYLQIKSSFLRERFSILDKNVSFLRDRLTKYPYYEQTLVSLEQEVQSNRSIYEKFLAQSQGSQISQQAQQAEAQNKFRIIEPASIPLKPVSPNKPKIIIFGAILGLGLGVGAVILAEFFDHSFRKVEDAENYLGLKVLGAVPKMDSLEKEFDTKKSN